MRIRKVVIPLLLLFVVAFSLPCVPVFATNEETSYRRSTSFVENEECLIVAKTDMGSFALSFDGKTLSSLPVTELNGVITLSEKAAVWKVHENNVIESVGTPGAFILSHMHGFMTYTEGNSLAYDAETNIIIMNQRYYLSFDADSGHFGQSQDADDAAKTALYTPVSSSENAFNDCVFVVGHAAEASALGVETLRIGYVKTDATTGEGIVANTAEVNADNCDNAWYYIEPSYGDRYVFNRVDGEHCCSGLLTDNVLSPTQPMLAPGIIANDDTVLILRQRVGAYFKSFKGIGNVPYYPDDGQAAPTAYALVENGLATVVYIDLTDRKPVAPTVMPVYVLGLADEAIADGCYRYKAISDGELQVIKADRNDLPTGLFLPTYDANGIVVEGTSLTDMAGNNSVANQEPDVALAYKNARIVAGETAYELAEDATVYLYTYGKLTVTDPNQIDGLTGLFSATSVSATDQRLKEIYLLDPTATSGDPAWILTPSSTGESSKALVYCKQGQAATAYGARYDANGRFINVISIPLEPGINELAIPHNDIEMGRFFVLDIDSGAPLCPAAEISVCRPTREVAAGSSTTADAVEEEGMAPVYPDQLEDGIYSAAVKSSSKMFNITDADLTVKEGKMTAVITMAGQGYTWMFMGETDKIATANESEFIPGVADENGKITFTIPVEALDKGIACAAYSKSQEKWYGRTILFRADSLSPSPFRMIGYWPRNPETPYWPQWNYLTISFNQALDPQRLGVGTLTSATGETIQLTAQRGETSYTTYLALIPQALELNTNYTLSVAANSIYCMNGDAYTEAVRFSFCTPSNVVTLHFPEYLNHFLETIELISTENSKSYYGTVLRGMPAVCLTDVEAGSYTVRLNDDTELGTINVLADTVNTFVLG